MTRPYKNLRELHPELFQLWYRVIEEKPTSKDPIVMDFAGKKDAIQTRKRLYYARVKMIEENVESSTQMVSYEIKLTGTSRLEIGRPAWLDAVKAALGSDPPPLPPGPEPQPAELPQETARAINALFGGATHGKEGG